MYELHKPLHTEIHIELDYIYKFEKILVWIS